MKSIPIIPMIRILKKYAAAHGFTLNPKNWNSIMHVFELYNEDAKFLN